jgi:outer membrane efflux protein
MPRKPAMPRIVIKALNMPIRAALCVVMALAGCTNQRQFVADLPSDNEQSADQEVKQVAYTSYEEPIPNEAALPPCDLDSDPSSIPYWDLSLEEAIQFALANSTVMREVGAHLLQAPELTPTIYDPSLRATDPRFGEEAALSAFDAQLGTGLFYEKNDRALNNSLLGGGTNFFDQDLWRLQTELSKQAATGTKLAFRHNVEDDLNNAPRNIFGTEGDIHAHAWTWNLEAEVRHPLLRGGGVDFNRLAGPDAVPGEIHGVLIARVNTSISAADFQIAIRNYLSNVENAYWELVFAYRDLEAKKDARNRSLATWQRLKKLNSTGLAGAEDDKVAQAEEQYFRFQQEVETALAGRLADGTRTFNGSAGGSFQGVGGVFVAERRLRLIMGASITGGRLIRPNTEPQPAEVIFDWNQLVSNALAWRTELLQQRLRIKRRRMELKASRNFLLPQLDMVGRYRRRGLGDHLYDPNAPLATGGPNTHTGTDEWQMGVELNVPIGYRRAGVAVRNAELAIARATAIYDELERRIIHDVSNAVAEQSRLFQAVQTAYNRRSAAQRQYNILNSAVVQESARGRRIDFNLLLDSERRLADAEIAYYRATVAYAVALKNVNLETENLLAYCNVQLADARAY